MKRVALILAMVGILCVTAGQAQAYKHHGHHGHHGRYHHAYHGAYHGRMVVQPHYWAAPPVIVRPRVVYPPVYGYRYYSSPAFGFQYHGRGVSVGVGF